MVLLGFVIDGFDIQIETVESRPEQFALRIIDGCAILWACIPALTSEPCSAVYCSSIAYLPS